LENFDLLRILKYLPGIILGLTVHEFSHAYVANRCGDSTSKDQGRVTLNPFKHIDLMGFIMLIVAGFGWAKPVHFNEQNLRNPKYDVMKIAIAGPLSNAVIAMILSIILSAYISILPEFHSNWQWWDAMNHGQVINIAAINPAIQPVIRVIDDWFTNRPLALAFEVKVGKGKIFVCSTDLLTEQKNRPEARQLLLSVEKYLVSESFNPELEVEFDSLLKLTKTN